MAVMVFRQARKRNPSLRKARNQQRTRPSRRRGDSDPTFLHAIFIDGELTNPIPFDDLDLHFAEGDSQAASGTRNASAALLDLR